MSALCDKLRNAHTLRRLYSYRVSMIHRVSDLTPTLGVSLLALLLSACASVHPQKAAQGPATPQADATALTVVAEADLKRGDCRGASETYAKAAAVGDAKLARRATQVAMACEHLPAAWQAATRWRALAPGAREADAMYAAVALKLYRTAEARSAIHDFWHLEEQQDAAPAAPAPAAPDAPAPPRGAARASKSMSELTALLLEESDAPAVLIAMSGALEPTDNCPETLTRRRSPRRGAPRRTMPRVAALSSPRSTPRLIAARRRTSSSSICAPVVRRRARSIGGSRCWRSTRAT